MQRLLKELREHHESLRPVGMCITRRSPNVVYFPGKPPQYGSLTQHEWANRECIHCKCTQPLEWVDVCGLFPGFPYRTFTRAEILLTTNDRRRLFGCRLLP